MNLLHTMTIVFHVLIAAAIVGLVLLQRGRGADAGAGFGAGASGTVFGARGSASFLSRATAALAALFFATNLALAYMSGRKEEVPSSVVDQVQAPANSEQNTPPPLPNAPAAPESATQQPVETPAPAQGESQAPQAPK
jgi:preprotein translocase subunit SecG